MRSDEIADLFAKWLEEETVLDCTGSLDEFAFDMKCRVSALAKDSVVLASEHGDCTLTFRLDSPDTEFSYAEPRSISSALGLSLTPEQEQSSTLIALLHPKSTPRDSSKPRDKLQLMELIGWE
jgi:hypothetical protein